MLILGPNQRLNEQLTEKNPVTEKKDILHIERHIVRDNHGKVPVYGNVTGTLHCTVRYLEL